MRQVAPIAAWARVERADEHEVGLEGLRAFGAGDGDYFFFERLPQHFQRLLRKLGEFVEEEHAPAR